MSEIWKDVKSCEGYYQISNLGRVRSLGRVIVCSTGEKRRFKEKIKKSSLNKHGYLNISLCMCGKIKYYRSHRLVAEAFIPNPNNLPEVNHKDSIKTHNYPFNLEWCTKKENMNHARKNNFNKNGSMSLGSKLTYKDVVVIKKRLRVGEKCVDIAKDYPVSRSAIGCIMSGRCWSHVRLAT